MTIARTNFTPSLAPARLRALLPPRSDLLNPEDKEAPIEEESQPTKLNETENTAAAATGSKNEEKLTFMSEEELRNFLFSNSLVDKSFFQACAEYMSKLTETEAAAVQTAVQSLTIQTAAQNDITNVTQAVAKEVAREWDEWSAMQSSMPSWLQDVVCGFMVLASLITLNPAIIGMSAVGLALQASGAFQALAKAMPDTDARLGVEFGIALVMAACGGMASMADEGALTLAKGLTTFMGQLSQNTTLFLGESLMITNAWVDFFQGPCKISAEDAAILGMVVGMAFSLGSAYFAGKNATGANRLLAYVQKTAGEDFVKYLSKLSFWINMAQCGFEMASAAEQFKIAAQTMKRSDFERNVMATNMSKMTLLQGLVEGWTSILNQTQNNLRIISQNATTANQTFFSLADMMKQA